MSLCFKFVVPVHVSLKILTWDQTIRWENDETNGWTKGYWHFNRQMYKLPHTTVIINGWKLPMIALMTAFHIIKHNCMPCLLYLLFNFRSFLYLNNCWKILTTSDPIMTWNFFGLTIIHWWALGSSLDECFKPTRFGILLLRAQGILRHSL